LTNREKLLTTYLRVRRGLARHVMGIVPPDDVEDIVQETYVRAAQASERSEIRQPSAYLYRIAKNLAIDGSRQAGLPATPQDLQSHDELHAEQGDADITLRDAAAREEFGVFCDVVQRLPQQQRRALVLKKVYGYSQREIAVEMSISEKTVERHLALATERCTERLETRFARKIGEKKTRRVVIDAHKPRGGDPTK